MPATDHDHEAPGDAPEETRRPARRKRVGAAVAMRRAAEHLGELLGTAPTSVSSLQQREGGWTADVEVLELARIPDTSSVMATYRVTLDHAGELRGYERTRRYARGRIDRE